MVKKSYTFIKSIIQYFGWITLFFIPVFVIFNGFLFIGKTSQKDNILSHLELSAYNELININLYIKAQLNTIQNDLSIILNADEAQAYALNPSNDHLDQYEQMLYRFVKNKDEFLQIRVVETNGDVSAQINRSQTGTVYIEDNLGTMTNLDYYPVLSTLAAHQFYLTNFHFDHENKIALTVIQPLYVNHTIQSYIVVDVVADQFISIIQNLDNEYVAYLSFGLINDESLLLFDENGQYDVTVDPNYDIDEQINHLESNEFISYNIFDFENVSPNFDIVHEGDYIFYINMDYESAVQDSQYLLLRYPWVIIIFNILAFIFTLYLSTMIKSNSEKRLLSKANLYLSEQREDAIVMTDANYLISYVNQAFLDQYIYTLDDVIEKNLDELIGINGIKPLRQQTNNQAFETFGWTKTSTNIHVLKHIRIKSNQNVTQRHKQLIAIYSEPDLNLGNYQFYVKNKHQIVDYLKSFLALVPFDENKTALGFIRMNHVKAVSFARYIKNNSKYVNRVALLTNNYVLFDAHVDKLSYHMMIQDIKQLLERFHYLPTVSKDFSHVFLTTHASHTLYNYENLIDSLCATLAVAGHDPDYKHYQYSLDIRKQLERERLISSEIHNGYMNDEFFMVYQPQVDLKTGQYFGMEALLRWDNKRLGLISPYEFMPIIESSYFINQVTSMVLKKVIQDLLPIQKQLPKGFKVSINLTMFDFKNIDIIEKLIAFIEQSNLSNCHFVFEITESRQLDNIEHANQMIQLLHNHHISIAIDDFGTGYSSINALKKLDLDYVKIDRSFIKDYPEKDNGNMLQTMIHLIHDLDKRIIVEGTETKEHVILCKNHQCEYAQGYYYSRPVDIQTLIKVLK